MIALIVWAAAVTGGLWVDVPFAKQEKEGCGSAAVWMVMQYWKKSPAPVEEIHRELYSPEAGGVFASDMVDYFAAHDFDTFIFSGQWSDLRDHIASGRPLIVSLGASARGAPLHYVVVAGLEESQQIVLVNDPAQRKLWPMSRAEFEQRWAVMDRWTLLAVPKAVRMGIEDWRIDGLADSPILNPPIHQSANPQSPSEQTAKDLIEASNAFRRQDYASARGFGERALRMDPTNATANELLATIYFLQDNVDAALKYWNRLDQPRIDEIRLETNTRWDLVALERTMPVSRASILHWNDYRLARKRLDASAAFSAYTLELTPSESDGFDLNLRAAERRSFSWFSWLRGLPYRTINPEFTNIDGKSTNVSTLLRFDPNKRRAFGSLSGPLQDSVRYQVAVDARDEKWDWNGNRFRLWRQEVAAGITRIATDRFTWSTNVTASRRSSGFYLKPGGSAQYDLWVAPEKRFTLSTAIRGEAGRALSHAQRFARIEPAINIRWLPESHGNDYETRVSLRAGVLSGNVPFDELFSLGLDRDSDLRLRAHPATLDGRKGAALIASRYVLWNSEVAKSVADWTFLNLKLAPFVDIARVGKSYVDAGLDFRLSIASLVTLSVSVGHDFKSGRNVVFTDVVK